MELVSYQLLKVLISRERKKEYTYILHHKPHTIILQRANREWRKRASTNVRKREKMKGRKYRGKKKGEETGKNSRYVIASKYSNKLTTNTHICRVKINFYFRRRPGTREEFRTQACTRNTWGKIKIHGIENEESLKQMINNENQLFRLQKRKIQEMNGLRA